MNKLLIVFLLSLSLFSCKTIDRFEYITDYQTDTLYLNKIEFDSIYIKDSTVVKEKGDTVYFTKYLTKFKEKIKYRDSIKIEYKDRIQLVEKKVIEKQKWYRNYWIYSTICLLMLLILLLKSKKK